ncbi:MAG: radical SAM protein [Victivallaceae bacterium]|nr:radical SAM protein [Victivallaceae bacterium]
MVKKSNSGQYLFGPVASRRLGLSLGIDLVPYKTCSFNCVYCESGATTELTAERYEYVPTAEVIRQLDELLCKNPQIDYLTFSGAGEPTLHSGLGEIVEFLKKNYPEYKICLLTNSTMFTQPDIFQEISSIDLIVPSLDATCRDEYLKINRPATACDYDSFITGLIEFSNSFTGELWLEIFIVPGINDSDASIKRFAELGSQIKPDKVQFNTLDRPGCVPWITASSPENTMRFVKAMEPVCPVEAVGPFKYSTPITAATQSNGELQQRIMALISRRPCTAVDMQETLAVSIELLEQALAELSRQKSVKVEPSARGDFFRPA